MDEYGDILKDEDEKYIKQLFDAVYRRKFKNSKEIQVDPCPIQLVNCNKDTQTTERWSAFDLKHHADSSHEANV